MSSADRPSRGELLKKLAEIHAELDRLAKLTGPDQIKKRAELKRQLATLWQELLR
jgi:hypothetical protein